MAFHDSLVECTLSLAHSITSVRNERLSRSITRMSRTNFVTLTSTEPRCECFCGVVPRKGQRLKELELFLAGTRAIYPSLQVRSDNEEPLKHVLKAGEQVHLEYSNTRLETPATDGRCENSVRAAKVMVQRQESQLTRWASRSFVKHPVFALIARHSEWILNDLVRNDFMVEDDNRVIKTSPYENHTGNSAPRSTQLLTRILVGRREIHYKQPGFQ